MTYSKPLAQIIALRFSCRTYAREPVPEELCRSLREAAESLVAGPLGSSLRFSLLAAEPGDNTALRGLGTYGFIRSPAAFLVGAVKEGDRYLEDFGFAAESLVLRATDLGLGTCWVGGLFTRSSFARRMHLAEGERMPAVISVGIVADQEAARRGAVRRLAGGDRRLPWESLFFDARFGVPLGREATGPALTALEAVRLSPSASNKQPWRIVRGGRYWHFFLHRTPHYPPGLGRSLLGVEDLQRVDIGIAMSHFEGAIRDLGLPGRWVQRPPEVDLPDALTEYTVSWESEIAV